MFKELNYSAYIDNLTTVKKLGDTYKVVTMKIPIKRPGFEKDNYSLKGSVNTEKLDNNLVRAKTTVREYSLCNDFEWFCTITLDKKKYDRYNLKKFVKDLSQFIRDYRKKYHLDLQYLLVPEQHQDGAWHIHGLIKGVSMDSLIAFDDMENVPKKLLGKGYYNWLDLQDKFGFNSLGKIKSKAKVSNYITKYVNKDLGKEIELNAKSYYVSRGLNKPELIKKGTLTSTLKYEFENDYCSILNTNNIDNIIINPI